MNPENKEIMGRNQKECNTAKWGMGNDDRLATACKVLLVFLFLCVPTLYLFPKISSKTTYFTKKPIFLTFSHFRENVKHYWVCNKDVVETDEIITYL